MWTRKLGMAGTKCKKPTITDRTAGRKSVYDFSSPSINEFQALPGWICEKLWVFFVAYFNGSWIVSSVGKTIKFALYLVTWLLIYFLCFCVYNFFLNNVSSKSKCLVTNSFESGVRDIFFSGNLTKVLTTNIVFEIFNKELCSSELCTP